MILSGNGERGGFVGRELEMTTQGGRSIKGDSRIQMIVQGRWEKDGHLMEGKGKLS